jgi:ribonuclease P protein component
VIFVLRKRSDFLEMAKRGVFVKGRFMFLQACVAEIGGGIARSVVGVGGPRGSATSVESEKTEPTQGGAVATPAAMCPLFYGITASRKVSNAVKRNKVKRGLRVLIRDKLRLCVKDYRPRDLGANAFILSKKTIAGMVSGKRSVCSNCVTERAEMGFVFVFVATKRTPLAQWNDLQEDFQRLVHDGLRKLRAGH